MRRSLLKKHQLQYVAGFLITNLAAYVTIGNYAYRQIQADMNTHVLQSQEEIQSVMDDYRHSFQLFTIMLERGVEAKPKSAAIWKYLRKLDKQLQAIEGDIFDGLYIYYRNSYLYSWDTPSEQYERSECDATTCPRHCNVVDAKGEIVFTPPCMSFANHYILSIISQLQPNQKTVLAYDIKMGNIQKLIASLQVYDKEQLIIFDKKGTIIGSAEEDYLDGNLMQNTEENREQSTEVNNKLRQTDSLILKEDRKELEDEAFYAQAFYDFQNSFSTDFNSLLKDDGMQLVDYQNQKYLGLIQQENEPDYLILAPVYSILSVTLQIWLIPLLILGIILIYVLSQISKELKNRELEGAHVGLGQTQKRLEIALQTAQRAAAIDELTGTVNMKPFRSTVKHHIQGMEKDEDGVLIMIDGDHFKSVDDQYGRSAGDGVIHLTAQMTVDRVRTVDYTSRLHGDEFTIFVSNTRGYRVAEKIMENINLSLAREAQKRDMPAITLSSDAIIACPSDNYVELIKVADEALYRTKEMHDGAFRQAEGR